MLNLTILTGRLTDNPTITQTEDSRYCCFSIAVDCPTQKSKTIEINIIDCIAWEATGEIIAKWYKKGDMITVVGNLRNNKTSTSVTVREVYFGNSKKKCDNSEDMIFPEIDPAVFEKVFSGEDVPF